MLYTLIAASQLEVCATPIEDWQKITLDGSARKLDGQYDAALQLYTKALNFAENNKLPPKCLPISLCRLAGVEVLTSKIAEADQHFHRIVDIIRQQKEAGTLDPQVVFWVSALSDEYLGNKLPKTRETCLRHACCLKALIYNDSNKECLGCLNKLADYYIEQGNTDQAIHYLMIIEKIIETKSGKDPDRLGDRLHHAAIFSETNHKYEQAKKLELAVIELAKKSSGYLNAGLPAFYNFLSLSAYIQNKITESKEYYQMALDSCPKIKNSRKKEFMLHAVQYFHSPNYEKISWAMKEFELKQQLKLIKAMSNGLEWQYIPYNLLHTVLAKEGKSDESEKYLLKAIAAAKVPGTFWVKDLSQLYLDLAISKGFKKQMSEANQAFINAVKSEVDKNGLHPISILYWWGLCLQYNKQYPLAFEKLNLALKKVKAFPPEARGMQLAVI